MEQRCWNLRSRSQYWRLFRSTPGRFLRRSIKAGATCPGSEKCAAYVRGKWGVCLRERGHFLRGNQTPHPRRGRRRPRPVGLRLPLSANPGFPPLITAFHACAGGRPAGRSLLRVVDSPCGAQSLGRGFSPISVSSHSLVVQGHVPLR